MSQLLPSTIAEVRATETGHDIFTSSILPPFAFDKENGVKKVSQYAHSHPFRMDYEYLVALVAAVEIKVGHPFRLGHVYM